MNLDKFKDNIPWCKPKPTFYSHKEALLYSNSISNKTFFNAVIFFFVLGTLFFCLSSDKTFGTAVILYLVSGFAPIVHDGLRPTIVVTGEELRS